MNKQKIEVQLELTDDGPTSMSFLDVNDGLEDPRYRFERTQDGGIHLAANREGFEWLGRYFLKLARTEKHPEYHDHLRLDSEVVDEAHQLPELIVGFQAQPPAA